MYKKHTLSVLRRNDIRAAVNYRVCCWMCAECGWTRVPALFFDSYLNFVSILQQISSLHVAETLGHLLTRVTYSLKGMSLEPRSSGSSSGSGTCQDPCVYSSVLFAECGLRNAFNLSRTLRSFSEMSKKKTRKRAWTVRLIFSYVCETHVGIPKGQHWMSRA